jgi:hypothetical protein
VVESRCHVFYVSRACAFQKLRDIISELLECAIHKTLRRKNVQAP